MSIQAAIDAEPSFSMGRYTLKEAAQAIAKGTGESKELLEEKIKNAFADNLIRVYAPGSKIDYQPTIIRDFYEVAYWNDLNQWLERYLPRLDFRFPAPISKSDKGSTGKSSGEPFIRPPKNQDEWFAVIEAVMYNHKNQHGNFPTWQQVWSELWSNPPKGYGVTLGKDRYGKNALLMGDQTLNRDSLYKRFIRWTGANK